MYNPENNFWSKVIYFWISMCFKESTNSLFLKERRLWWRGPPFFKHLCFYWSLIQNLHIFFGGIPLLPLLKWNHCSSLCLWGFVSTFPQSHSKKVCYFSIFNNYQNIFPKDISMIFIRHSYLFKLAVKWSGSKQKNKS